MILNVGKWNIGEHYKLFQTLANSAYIGNIANLTYFKTK